MNKLNARDYDNPSYIYFYPNRIANKQNIVKFIDDFIAKQKAEEEAADKLAEEKGEGKSDVTYVIEYHAHIHLTGDGAAWIRQGIELYPGVEYHLDKFHVQRALTTLCVGNKELLRDLSLAVYNGEKRLFYSLCDKNGIRSKDAQREILYLVDNLEYIDRESHCCAESHVSHVLSARMSSRPMGWNKSGADRIGKLRAFMFNKGDFRELFEMQSEITQEKEKQGNYVPNVDGKGYEPPRYKIAELKAVYSRYARVIKNYIKNI